MTDSAVEDQERSLTLQRYLNLQDRQQHIRRRLSSSSSLSSGSAALSAVSSHMSFPTLPSGPSGTIMPSPPHSPTRVRNHIRGGGMRSRANSSPTGRRIPNLSTATSTTSDEQAIDDADSLETLISSPNGESPTNTNSSSPESDLLELNNDIKATLTTLLNLPSVRHHEEGEMRMWVQERLMDAEQEIKRLKRVFCRYTAEMGGRIV